MRHQCHTHLYISLFSLRGGKKKAAKWPKMIIFWIFKCLWNCLIEMLQLVGGRGQTGKAAAKWPKIIGFWIFKCLWNHLIKTLLVGGSGG